MTEPNPMHDADREERRAALADLSELERAAYDDRPQHGDEP